MVELSPGVRGVLTVVATVVTALGTLIATGQIGDLPEWVGVVIAVLSTIFGALNINPPQNGGTQVGVVNPTLKQP